ncbi:MAG TPA: 3-oxoacyl-[acyl-carrier-protein] reductase [Bacteroidota bacterium]|nr:3-oxoacyl-[acyl-carrier-protein] reductase [Bacteroidota bacterium]
MADLSGKTALVTGGSRGIGRAIALAFAGAGADVAITFRSAAGEAEKVVRDIETAGRRAKAFKSDAADCAAAAAVVDAVLAGFSRLDILVNNAGITKDGLLMRMSEVDWDSVIATNLKSVFNFSKAAIRPMMSRRSGKIINISSIAGVIGNPGQTNYAASKAGMIGFTKSLARELGSRNIQVNAIAPGFIDTDMTAALTAEQRQKLEQNIPLRRTGTAGEIAGVACFLASSGSDYITGQVFCVDGGMVM